MNKKHLLVASAALAAMVATDGATTAHADENKANAPVASQATEGTKTTDSVQTLTSEDAVDATDKSDVEADEEAEAETDAKDDAEKAESETDAKDDAEKTESEADAKDDAEKTESEADAKDDAEKTESEADAKDDAEKTESETEATDEAAKPKVNAPVKEAPKATQKKSTPAKPAQKKSTPAKPVASAKAADKQDLYDAKYIEIGDRYYELTESIWDMVIEDPYFLEDLSDSELDDFLNTYYYNVIDMYNELLAFIEANGADDDLLEALADMEEYLYDFEDIFDYVFDDYVEEDENSADQGQGVSINPEAIGATNHNTADTRMAKYHGQANALPETASDQQNGLAIAGAALLAGLGALGFAKKRA
ncbi:LPXTG cell wall anchor domain-containing protein [Weissella minor]|uniref:Gram-positive cocci surface proteins LPxTG domain-containing protein n=1 Tax=Weissella minor TaxID=1620 RepID=A0A0R2JH64_9LACO|nr:LPXTG cell wall anchor domain-containing protein [Weissella minor]KRN76670.1 hypothetical protein IV67_GL000174 [Weissella minor]